MKHENIKTAFFRVINTDEFQLLVFEFRQRFGIPRNGFQDKNSEEYKNWINEALRKTDRLREEFLFIAKRCRNLAPRNNDPIPLSMLAYYFLYNEVPTISSQQNDAILSVHPSGILGSIDVVFTIPLVFGIENFLEEVDKHKADIEESLTESKEAVEKISSVDEDTDTNLDPNLDFLGTTPANGSDIVDRVHRYIIYLAEFGRVILKEHLSRMKDEDFTITKYEDKNKPISSPVQQMGMFLLNRGLYSITEEYWRQIDEEIIEFNKINNKNLNRGISLANQGVAQLAQGKVIEGLFNLYKAHKSDEDSLKHLSATVVDPERDLAQSVLFTQFEERQIAKLFRDIVNKHSSVFDNAVSEEDLKNYILGLSPDKKILLFVTLYRFSFSYELNKELSNPVNRGEILRSLSELALWYEDELKKKDPSLSGTLGNFMDQKIGQLNPTRGEYTSAEDLNELEMKIKKAIKSGGDLYLVNARIATCIRNFTGHNFASQSHSIFNIVDEVMARMVSLILYSKSQGWV